MPGAIPARHLVIEIADFHNKICHEQTSYHRTIVFPLDVIAAAPVQRRCRGRRSPNTFNQADLRQVRAQKMPQSAKKKCEVHALVHFISEHRLLAAGNAFSPGNV